jgi:hypothetical protein
MMRALTVQASILLAVFLTHLQMLYSSCGSIVSCETVGRAGGAAAMIRAILKNGVIKPAEPLPPDWVEGQELLVDRQFPSEDPQEIDRWAAQLDEAAAAIPADDAATLERALTDVERHSKEGVRREWGVP